MTNLGRPFRFALRAFFMFCWRALIDYALRLLQSAENTETRREQYCRYCNTCFEMDVHQIDFIPKQSLDQLNEDVQLAMRTTFDADFNEIRDLPLDLQRAEALEALGISEFYYGVYNDALEHLEKSLSYANTLERRGQHRIIFIKLLVNLMFMVCLQFFSFQSIFSIR
jgi:hypothetical protein